MQIPLRTAKLPPTNSKLIVSKHMDALLKLVSIESVYIATAAKLCALDPGLFAQRGSLASLASLASRSQELFFSPDRRRRSPFPLPVKGMMAAPTPTTCIAQPLDSALLNVSITNYTNRSLAPCRTARG